MLKYGTCNYAAKKKDRLSKLSLLALWTANMVVRIWAGTVRACDMCVLSLASGNVLPIVITTAMAMSVGVSECTARWMTASGC